MSKVLWFILGGLTTAVGIGVVAMAMPEAPVADDSGSTGTDEIGETDETTEITGMDEAATIDIEQPKESPKESPDESPEESSDGNSGNLTPENPASSTDSQLTSTPDQGDPTAPTGEKNND